MALSIRQKAKNYTVYPIVPLKVALPAASVANSLLAVLVIGQRTPYNFNEDLLVTETVAPVVTDDVGNVYTQQNQIVDLYTELSTSPPVVSPDASGYFPSVYLFTSPATPGGSPAVQPSTIYVTDAGLYGTAQSPPTLGRPVFDGGITALGFEIAGKYTGSARRSWMRPPSARAPRPRWALASSPRPTTASLSSSLASSSTVRPSGWAQPGYPPRPSPPPTRTRATSLPREARTG